VLFFSSILAFRLILKSNKLFYVFNIVCRVGRTARAGRSGMAISLITPYDILRLGEIEDQIKTKLTEYKIDGKNFIPLFVKSVIIAHQSGAKIAHHGIHDTNPSSTEVFIKCCVSKCGKN
jgi:superfamily II DNA/RNA helicase